MNYKIYWRNPDSKENHLVHASNALDPALHVLEPTLDQAVNSHGSLSFKVLPTNPEYGSIRKLMTVVTVHDGDDLIFRGRVIETTQDIDGIVSVYCEGELAFLCDSVHTPFVYGGSTATPGDLFRRLIANHNAYTTSIDNSNREKLFTVGQVTIPARKGYTYSADTARSTWDLLIDGLINQLGGYLRTRHADDGTTYIDYLADYTGTAQQTVEYGKNLLSLEDGIVGGDIVTVLLPYGGKPEGVDARTTIESVNNGKSYIKADAETIAKYRNIWGTQTWDEITDPGQLLQAAQSYLNAQKEALNTVSAEALDLSAVDAGMKPIYVGDYVRIISTPHGINKKLLCTAKTTDLADPASTRITIGPKTQTLTSAVKNGDAAIRSSVAAAASVSGVANKALSDAGNAVADAASAQATAEAAQSTAADALAAAEAAASAAADKAPKAHASTATSYGVGDGSKYGHVKLSDSANSTLGASNGTAATPIAVKKAYDTASAAQNAAEAAQAAAESAASEAAAASSAVSGKAPTDHASSATTYGKATGSYYGHSKLSDATNSTLSAASGGTAATPAAVKAAYDLASQASSAASSAYDLANEAGQVATDAAQTAADAQSAAEAAQAAVGGKAPTNHASTVTTYGKGTSTNYGHVKLSDSILSTSDTAGGTAATPGAVKKAYDLANRAETTLLGGKKIVCGWSAISFKSTGQTNTTINFGTTFTAKPIVIIGQPFNGVICTVFKDSVTTTKFTVNVPAVGSSTVSTRQMAWVAIGSV